MVGLAKHTEGSLSYATIRNVFLNRENENASQS